MDFYILITQNHFIFHQNPCRFDSAPMFEKFGMSSIDNEFHVSKNILRPTRKIRDEIDILSKYREPARRYNGKYHKKYSKI